MKSEILFSSQTGVLSAGKRQVFLTDQSRRCLLYFYLNAGQLVSREAFARDCWGSRGLVVSDATVRQTIFRLRRSFSELGLDDDILQTKGKSGYLLVSGVITLKDASRKASDSAAEGPVSPAVSVKTEAAEASLLEPSSPAPVANEVQRQPAWLSLFSLRSGLTLLLLLLCAGAGYLYRLHEMVTTVNYTFSHREGDRSYYVSTLVGAAQVGDATGRAASWLAKDKIPVKDSRYVYINGIMGEYLFIMSCTGPVNEHDSGCSTLTILGRFHL
jgi:DNA-binding winged helix-turn-helix (wHTH) protein